MPDMDGLAVIRTAQERCPGLPAVLLTGSADDPKAKAVTEGVSAAFSVLHKPIAPTKLAEHVALVLAGVTRKKI